MLYRAISLEKKNKKKLTAAPVKDGRGTGMESEEEEQNEGVLAAGL